MTFWELASNSPWTVCFMSFMAMIAMLCVSMGMALAFGKEK